MNKLKAVLYIVVFLIFIIGSVFFISEARKAIDMLNDCIGIMECLHRSLSSILTILSCIFILLFFAFMSIIILSLAEEIE